MKNETIAPEDQADHEIGLEIIRVLNLHRKRDNGRIETTQGDKNPCGLARTLRHLAQPQLPKPLVNNPAPPHPMRRKTYTRKTACVRLIDNTTLEVSYLTHRNRNEWSVPTARKHMQEFVSANAPRYCAALEIG